MASEVKHKIRNEKSSTFSNTSIPIIVSISLGLCLSVFMFFYVRHKEYQNIESDFIIIANERVNSLKRELEGNLEVLRSLQSLYASSTSVTREEFRRFCRQSLLHHPGIQALEWIPRIPNLQREDYEKKARIDGYPDYQITKLNEQNEIVRANESNEYFPVYFVEPYKGNELSLGFDLTSNPARLEALNKSRDTGENAATSRISLIKQDGEQFGFMVFAPIYDNLVRIGSAEKRDENLEGFVSGVFDIKNMVDNSLTLLC